LLEVGTGMHPELTGRENILLNGAVLGMKKVEILDRFDEIVDFSGVDRFIDTPLKHYSSGMQVRLAFSVAAHLEPEILLVDEVLAVGDMSFQKKCLGKMDEVAKGGRTVIFVSHQMNAIRRLCSRCMLLDGGSVEMDGPTSQVIGAYEASFLSKQTEEEHREEDDGAMPARWLKWGIAGMEDERANVLSSQDAVTFVFTVKVNKPFFNGRHGVTLFDSEGRIIWGTAIYELEMEEGVYEFAYTLPSLPIRPGVYYFRVSLYSEFQMLDVWECIPELVVDIPPLTHPRDEWSGILNTPYDFVRTRLE
jgi:homopolymeric O-antigen transport system ATP-binding protein